MGKLANIIPVSDLRQDAAAVLRRVRESSEPVIITQRGRAAAVLVSAETYERAEHGKALLDALLTGARESEEGHVYDFDEVVEELRTMLREGRP